MTALLLQDDWRLLQDDWRPPESYASKLLAQTSFAGHCQVNLNRLAKFPNPRRSGHKLTPFGQGCGAVLLEDVAAVEVTFLVEMIVD